MGINIRQSVKTDISEIVRLCRDHAAYEQCDYDEAGKAENLSKALFEDKKLYCLIAETENEEIIGYTTYMRQYSTWDATEYLYMDCLYVDDLYRGQRTGERLVDEIKEYGKKHSINLIQWQTPDFNDRAIKFYKRIGATSKSKERFFLKC